MEFTGTMMFVMCIVLSSTSGDPLAPLSIGFSLMILIFMGSHVSGSHYNPAVTFGVWLSGRQQIPFYRACLYMLAQVAGIMISEACPNNDRRPLWCWHCTWY